MSETDGEEKQAKGKETAREKMKEKDVRAASFHNRQNVYRFVGSLLRASKKVHRPPPASSSSTSDPIPLSGPLASPSTVPRSTIPSSRLKGHAPRLIHVGGNAHLRDSISAGEYASRQRELFRLKQALRNNSSPYIPLVAATPQGIRRDSNGEIIWCAQPATHPTSCCCCVTGVREAVGCDPATYAPFLLTSSTAEAGAGARGDSNGEIIWCDYPNTHPSSCCCSIRRSEENGAGGLDLNQVDWGAVYNLMEGFMKDGGNGTGGTGGEAEYCECHGHPVDLASDFFLRRRDGWWRMWIWW
ncbi:hypothetical protein I302_106720 [Kwoniella bestiolae CBS 10118]|uniref:Uncharacterized protein n=1 Tax=Kwoniella bestiolae CBS 10118 TaxID=1296100 RepID=A0A1B9G0L0_9TREE|nr:hypothetical protein I302_06016 [Kwoniella bestiolae CBS 10118]OCF24555.1 hypothetical protein I302_06016 [Kwoniella bestiolae CBS 10118]